MSNYEIHLMRMRGYSDGAGARPMQPKYSQDSSYAFAYSWGQQEKRQFADLSAHSLGLDIQSVHALESKHLGDSDHVGSGGSTAKVPTELEEQQL